MSTNSIIKVENLSKSYIIQHKEQNANDTLIQNMLSGIKGLSKFKRRNSNELFHALHDISFEIERGDRVGIIGRNGAGKSTLLKILSRISPPTKGRIEINGRMASLLEVGTGFHGDLSGRENIFLNGSILGMTKREIQSKFDEIVDFSEIEKFIDTPVKRYSSGMYVRLAFAVAAHLEPDILIVDEVLAVGDAAFQKKCLGKMEDVSANQGRTILFVSHQMDAVQKLCNKGILLNKGQLLETGDINKIVQSYINNNQLSNGFFEIQKNQVENVNDIGALLDASILDANKRIVNEIPTGENWAVSVRFKINKTQPAFVIGLGLQSMFGSAITTSWSEAQAIEPGIYEATFYNQDIFYTSGQYKIAIGLSNNHQSYFYNDTEVYLTISDVGSEYQNHRIINKASGLILNQNSVEIKQHNHS
jgi:lipopolysaccharide transport system ATP-binding protein